MEGGRRPNQRVRSQRLHTVNLHRRIVPRLHGVDQQIDIPTLFIGATHDIVIALQQIEAMKPLVNDLTMHMLDCGHWTQAEKPQELNALMTDWLAGRFR